MMENEHFVERPVGGMPTRHRKNQAWIALAAGLAAAVGCGGGNGPEPPVEPPPLNIRDETFDRAGEVTVTENAENFAQQTHRIEVPGYVAPTPRWTMRVSGLCGQSCRNGPRHMYSAAFGNTLLVSWMAVDPDDPWRQYGNVATFEVSDTGEFTLKRNVAFDGMCEATYGIETNADGSIIAVLCRGIQGVLQPLEGSTNLLGTRRREDCDEQWEGRCYPIGNYSEIDSALYILEYRGGQVTGEPDDVVYVNHAVGGWRYGHHELLLNEAQDLYFVSLKVTAGPSRDNRHEGMTRFAVRRSDSFAYVPINDEWGCGPGHVHVNRAAYNRSLGTFSQVCSLDYCEVPSQFENNRCDGISFSTIRAPEESGSALRYDGEILLELDRGENMWNLHGGVQGVLSLGADGWMAVASGPGYPGAPVKPATIGVIRLPPTVEELRELEMTVEVPQFEEGAQVGVQEAQRYQWNWLYLPEKQTDNDGRAGFGQLAYFDSQGENSQRLLIGWSPTVAFQGITEEYYVSELDRDGNLRGEPYRLVNAGWGEDNRWTTMPTSGCVVFPYTWVGDAPGSDYPIESDEAEATDFLNFLYLTSVCPNSDAQPALADTPPAIPDSERWPSP
jgi:hypothetical protein